MHQSPPDLAPGGPPRRRRVSSSAQDGDEDGGDGDCGDGISSSAAVVVVATRTAVVRGCCDRQATTSAGGEATEEKKARLSRGAVVGDDINDNVRPTKRSRRDEGRPNIATASSSSSISSSVAVVTMPLPPVLHERLLRIDDHISNNINNSSKSLHPFFQEADLISDVMDGYCYDAAGNIIGVGGGATAVAANNNINCSNRNDAFVLYHPATRTAVRIASSPSSSHHQAEGTCDTSGDNHNQPKGRGNGDDDDDEIQPSLSTTTTMMPPSSSASCVVFEESTTATTAVSAGRSSSSSSSTHDPNANDQLQQQQQKQQQQATIKPAADDPTPPTPPTPTPFVFHPLRCPARLPTRLRPGQIMS